MPISQGLRENIYCITHVEVMGISGKKPHAQGGVKGRVISTPFLGSSLSLDAFINPL